MASQGIPPREPTEREHERNSDAPENPALKSGKRGRSSATVTPPAQERSTHAALGDAPKLWHASVAMARTRVARHVGPVVPRTYGGKWVAWTRDGKRIVAAGGTPEEARAAARRAGVSDIAYEWVPPAGELFIGGHTAG